MSLDTMRLNTQPGEKVRFLGENGHDFQLEHAKTILTVGDLYTVEHLSVGDFSSTVYFEEVPGGFNSVMFENA